MGMLFGSRESRATGATGATFAEPPIPPFPGANIYGGNSFAVRPESSLTIPTVWACISRLANAVSMLPLNVYSRTSDGIPRQIPTPPLLANPTGDMTQSEWLHMLMVSLLIHGNGIGLMSGMDQYGRPSQIALMDPNTVSFKTDAQGNPQYKIIATGQDITANVWHIRGMTLPGSRWGLNPIDMMASILNIDISSRQFALDFFAGGGIPKAVIKSNLSINQEQSRTIKDRLRAATLNREPIVLADGLDYTAISVKPDESQFLATQHANISLIANYFGIPPEMVGGSSGGNLTYANVEQRQLDFLTLGVQFWLKRIEDSVSPLFSRPQYARFDTAALLRVDAETQAKVDNQHLAGKTRTPTELRQRDGLPPMTADQKAEVDLVPLTVTPLGGVKALPAIKDPGGPAATVPANDQEGALSAA